MPRILFRYIFREVVYPAALSLGGLTLILFLAARAPGFRDEHLAFMLMRLFFRPDVGGSDLLRLLATILPSIMMFILPMALLVGILIGVGRMTLDLEVRAMQTGGIPLYILFLPILVLSAAISGGIAFMTWGPEPMMIRSSVSRIANLLVSEFSNLEPGRVYTEVFGGDSGMNLYFDDREKDSSTMKDVTLLIDQDAVKEDEREARLKALYKQEEKRLKALFEEGGITREAMDRQLYDLKVAYKKQNPVLIFAEGASFDADPAKGEVKLDLYGGSMHVLDSEPDHDEETAAEESPEAAQGEGAPNPNDRQYVVLSFGRMRKTQYLGGIESAESRRTQTIPELMTAMKDPLVRERDRLRAKATILERLSGSLQCFVLAFIGLPLAVSVRPSGKSVGVVLAFGLILLYQWMLRTGYSMIESEHALGIPAIFLPNLLFVGAGLFLWRRSLRA